MHVNVVYKSGESNTLELSDEGTIQFADAGGGILATVTVGGLDAVELNAAPPEGEPEGDVEEKTASVEEHAPEPTGDVEPQGDDAADGAKVEGQTEEQGKGLRRFL